MGTPTRLAPLNDAPPTSVASNCRLSGTEVGEVVAVAALVPVVAVMAGLVTAELAGLAVPPDTDAELPQALSAARP